MFQLTKKEWKEVITNCNKLPESIKFSPATPFAFTEHGVTMLASVLHSKKAIKMSIAVVRAFIAFRQLAMNYKELAEKIKELEKRYDKQFADIYEALELLLDEKNQREDFSNREPIGFKINN